mgnify:CR=1 FL=1
MSYQLGEWEEGDVVRNISAGARASFTPTVTLVFTLTISARVRQHIVIIAVIPITIMLVIAVITITIMLSIAVSALTMRWSTTTLP